MGDSWRYLPTPALFKIFQNLDYKEVLKAGHVCKRWNELSRDEFLWKRLFHLNFKIETNVTLLPGNLWSEEFKRLCYHIPIVQTETLTEHCNEVLHVSFSNNGKYFATCSKDGSVLVWNSSYPSTIKYSCDMKVFSWKYTQYSQFNESDTLLLVSGVHFGTPSSTSGEIAVFSLQDKFELKCRVVSKPYDIFGTWYSDQHLLAGDLSWLAHLVSTSSLTLNKASQETQSEHVPITKNMYRFYNRNASSIRTIMIANCWPNSENVGDNTELKDGSCKTAPGVLAEKGNPISHRDIDNLNININNNPGPSAAQITNNENFVDFDTPIRYSADYRLAESQNVPLDSDTESDLGDTPSPSSSQVKSDSSIVDCSCWDSLDDDETLVPNDKYLIFTTGYKTYTPHQIGFKRIKPFVFPKRIDPGLSLKDRSILHEKRKELTNEEMEARLDWSDYDSVSDFFDKIDHLIDLHGHIIGMGLSPDHRYLYVNTRPWPSGYVISHPLDPPPIAQEIDIHVIDLVTLKQVGTMLRSHKAYTPNNECFFIFLDVSQQYVASGAEDKHGYLWDRHFGLCLAKFPHTDVVNSVAFNPKDPEMLVTTSDDYTIKVWRSRAKVRNLKLNEAQFQRGVEVRKRRHRSPTNVGTGKCFIQESFPRSNN